jgi:hypothetical protein
MYKKKLLIIAGAFLFFSEHYKKLLKICPALMESMYQMPDQYKYVSPTVANSKIIF